jgi:hypothetical protein
MPGAAAEPGINHSMVFRRLSQIEEVLGTFALGFLLTAAWSGAASLWRSDRGKFRVGDWGRECLLIGFLVADHKGEYPESRNPLRNSGRYRHIGDS